ncbi:R3H-associated N-terminal domain-containing protein [Dichotomopilus funicola]|uniref:R3H-associated N-terminal domain-containing protein n=1 Tax=Dichotomopilus funicola TaxID=1934379 RepID=A0AAN6V4E6_9PEZI|nr:R3H-associated N-terminal domain-containing protein [Dichotomopilus funicola]
MAITRAPTVHDDDEPGDYPSQPSQPSQPLQHQGPPPPTHPAHPPNTLHQRSLSEASTVSLDIEAWTVSALESLSIAPIARGTGSALSIPLDGAAAPVSGGRKGGDGAVGEDAHHAGAGMTLRGVVFDSNADTYGANIVPPRRPPSRRDSMRKRDALLKGKEGSRQRRRWENDRLLHVPNVVPPQPSDWEIHPTHRVLPTVPYQLAQYWDKGLREQHLRRTSDGTRRRGGKAAQTSSPGTADPELGHVPRDLRNTAKRTPAVKSWLRALEEPVRAFVVERGLAAPLAATAAAAAAADHAADDNNNAANNSSSDETDPDDEEIVFVGRRGLRTRDGKPPQAACRFKMAQRQVAGRAGEEEVGMVLEMGEDDGRGGSGNSGGAFKRWLTHSISDYYGLDSKSALVGNPARRVIYVGVKPNPRPKTKQQHAAAGVHHHQSHTSELGRLPALPPPLWEMF